MLYPKEDRQNRSLLFACRNCDHQEEASNYCVYRHDIILPVMYFIAFSVYSYKHIFCIVNNLAHILIFRPTQLFHEQIKDLALSVDILRPYFSRLTTAEETLL